MSPGISNRLHPGDLNQGVHFMFTKLVPNRADLVASRLPRGDRQMIRPRFIPTMLRLEERCLLAVPTNYDINQASLAGNQGEGTIAMYVDPANVTHLFAAGHTSPGGPVFGAYSTSTNV